MTESRHTPPTTDPGAERRAERLVLLAFGTTIVAALGLIVLYVAGGQTQLEGLLLALCLGGLGVGIVLWSQELMPVGIEEEERHPLASDPEARRALAAALSAEGRITRRRLLVRGLLGAVGALGVAMLVPLLSLGPAPGNALRVTPWRRGARLVGLDGAPVLATDIGRESITTVFPEGHPGSPDGQTLLIHVDPALLQLAPERMDWAPQGYVAYSKVCTHAGCPVGLYRAETHQLLCPCHQSTFDVLRGAVPTYGPAARPLPQLPIQLQPDGTFVALGDFPEPVGPSFWDMYR